MWSRGQLKRNHTNATKQPRVASRKEFGPLRVRKLG
jgi:hypothetical protein